MICFLFWLLTLLKSQTGQQHTSFAFFFSWGGGGGMGMEGERWEGKEVGGCEEKRSDEGAKN